MIIDVIEFEGFFKELFESVFKEDKQSKYVRIPKGTKKIEDLKYYNCRNLERIFIPNGVKSIGDNTFDSCSNLVNIFIPESIKFIGQFAFFGCSNLKFISLPKCSKRYILNFYGYPKIRWY